MEDGYAPDRDAEKLLDEAEAMIWSLLDGTLDEPQSANLESLMKTNGAVLARYLECVQLETELRKHFTKIGAAAPGVPGPAAPAAATPILPPLTLDPMPGMGFMPPVFP